jgi:acyl carrier protein
MNTTTDTALADLLIDWVRRNSLNGSSDIVITQETNLLEAGLLDSLGFVELILFLEKHCGRKIDLNDVSPEQFTVVKGLCQIALRSHAAS